MKTNSKAILKQVDENKRSNSQSISIQSNSYLDYLIQQVKQDEDILNKIEQLHRVVNKQQLALFVDKESTIFNSKIIQLITKTEQQLIIISEKQCDLEKKDLQLKHQISLINQQMPSIINQYIKLKDQVQTQTREINLLKQKNNSNKTKGKQTDVSSLETVRNTLINMKQQNQSLRMKIQSNKLTISQCQSQLKHLHSQLSELNQVQSNLKGKVQSIAKGRKAESYQPASRSYKKGMLSSKVLRYRENILQQLKEDQSIILSQLR